LFLFYQNNFFMISTITLFSGEDQSNPTGKQKKLSVSVVDGETYFNHFYKFCI
jgi:hypothetical protein